MRKRFPRLLRWVAVGAVLGVAALVIPDSAVKSTEIELVKVQRADGVDLTPEVVWILAVGSDARPGEDMTRTRGDALQLVGMNTRTGAATAIGIPRDSWVPIPGYGSSRVNAALAYGGPQLLGRTVGDLVGIQPDYVFVTRFPYFEDMVNEIGGITVHNPRPFYDENLNRKGFKSGQVHLNGYGAMAFSRIRKSLPGGDFDRSANQQRVLRGIQARVRARAAVPGFIERGVLSVMAHMHTDLSPAELFRLAQATAHVVPSKITSCVVQGSIGNVGGASVVLPYVDQARRYGNEARQDATIERC
ncbi:LCP family protein [Nocardioides soli]|uniref:LCP family protein required for cell wall assembly n=1 Tax=Nocardioides soli TaxID=1036020 RepID=A0A7W4VS31_9ACTN|nr:LCP family protein [Nocardioides soli]MBB3040761.1 LCP family protein required for cell wall assembly [Nocardioides soli]